MMERKAALEVGGVAMVLRPLEALLDSPAIGKVTVLAQEPSALESILPDDPRVELRQSRDTIAATIADLISKRALDYPVLVTTADHALLDKAMIAEFIAKAQGADLAIGVVERNVMLRRFPSSERTWIGFKRRALQRRQSVRFRIRQGCTGDRHLAHRRAGPQERLAAACRARTGAAAWRGAQTAHAG